MLTAFIAKTNKMYLMGDNINGWQYLMGGNINGWHEYFTRREM